MVHCDEETMRGGRATSNESKCIPEGRGGQFSAGPSFRGPVSAGHLNGLCGSVGQRESPFKCGKGACCDERSESEILTEESPEKYCTLADPS